MDTLVIRFMGPTWGPPGADRTQVGPMLVPWSLLSRYRGHTLGMPAELSQRQHTIYIQTRYVFRNTEHTVGVPQGSISDPVLCLLRINNIPNWVSYWNLRSFANGTTISPKQLLVVQTMEWKMLRNDIQPINENWVAMNYFLVFLLLLFFFT